MKNVKSALKSVYNKPKPKTKTSKRVETPTSMLKFSIISMVAHQSSKQVWIKYVASALQCVQKPEQQWQNLQATTIGRARWGIARILFTRRMPTIRNYWLTKNLNACNLLKYRVLLDQQWSSGETLPPAIAIRMIDNALQGILSYGRHVESLHTCVLWAAAQFGSVRIVT